jgi:hypothetical protein
MWRRPFQEWPAFRLRVVIVAAGLVALAGILLLAGQDQSGQALPPCDAPEVRERVESLLSVHPELADTDDPRLVDAAPEGTAAPDGPDTLSTTQGERRQCTARLEPAGRSVTYRLSPARDARSFQIYVDELSAAAPGQ